MSKSLAPLLGYSISTDYFSLPLSRVCRDNHAGLQGPNDICPRLSAPVVVRCHEAVKASLV